MDYKTTYILSECALYDLEQIISYYSINLSNKKYATELHQKIEECFETLIMFPNMGKNINDQSIKNNYNIKKIIVEGYIIYYLFEDEKDLITILRIASTKRNETVVLEQIKSTQPSALFYYNESIISFFFFSKSSSLIKPCS